MDPISPRRTPFTAWEGLVLLALWAASVVATLPHLARPLGTAHDWLTAHTLLSIRGYEAWGFGTLWGASCLAPHAAEWAHADPTPFGKGQGLYLSYPPGTYWLAYAAYLIARALGLAGLSPDFLAGWSLLSVRGAGLIMAYLLLRELGTLAGAGPRLAAAAGLTGASCWLFAPDVLHFTQETLGPDQAVLPFLFFATWLALRARFDAAAVSGPAGWLLGAALGLACFIDWYAWLAAGALAAAFAAGSGRGLWGARRPWLVLPPLVAGLVYAAELAHFPHGLGDLVRIATERIGAPVAAPGGADFTAKWMRFVAFVRAFDYLPPAYGLAAKPFFDAVNDHRLPPAQVLAGLAGLGAVAGYGLRRAWADAPDRRALAIALALLAGLPAVQLLILRQHSFVHSFSALKLALPLAALAVTLPLAGLARGGRQPLRAGLAAWLAVALVAPLVATAEAASRRAGGSGDATLTQMGRLVRDLVGPGDLPLSADLIIRAWPSITRTVGMPLEANFLAGRLVYDPPYLLTCLPLMVPADLAAMRPVVIYDEALGPRAFGPWIQAAGPPLGRGTVGGRAVVVRAAPRLRARLLAPRADLLAGPPDNKDYLGPAY